MHPSNPPTIVDNDNSIIPDSGLTTPLKKKVEGFQPFSLEGTSREKRIADMKAEVIGHIVGPMPLESFIDHFFPEVTHPLDNAINQTKKTDFIREISKLGKAGKSERKMYQPFVDAMKIVCPDYPAEVTSEKNFSTTEGIDIKPDITFRAKNQVLMETPNSRPNARAMEMFAELKVKDKDDAFLETNIPPLDNDRYNLDHNPSKQGEHTLGQITTYTILQQSAQFRTHVFSMLIFKDHGRLLFWDCSGVVVTERFKLINDNFFEFLCRYNIATARARGYDETVIDLLDVEEETARASSLFEQGARLVKVKIERNWFIYAVPLWMGTGSPFGRSTCNFAAYNLDKLSSESQQVLIKDTWRVDTRRREDHIYERLKKENVPFIPTIIAAANVQNQASICSTLIEKANSWGTVFPKLRKFRHYRMVLKEVGSPLANFKSTRELVTVFRDVFQGWIALEFLPWESVLNINLAHQTAHLKADVLHRDISAANILIGPDGHGLLVDWDLCKYRADPVDAVERSSHHKGTWQFLAARLLTSELNKHQPTANFCDDIESFLHVMTWTTFRYTPTTYSREMLTAFLTSTYGTAGCVGQNKLAHLGSAATFPPQFSSAFHALKPSPLRDLLLFLTRTVSSRYENRPFREQGMSESQYQDEVEKYQTKLQSTSAIDSKEILKEIDARLQAWPDNNDASIDNLGPEAV